MRVDFYQLSRDPAEAVLPLIARKVLDDGERLLVVAAEAERREAIGRELWSRLADTFLAHGHAGGAHDARQPILIAADVAARANGAGFVAIADGVWREGEPGFARTFYLFAEPRLDEARATWRMLGTREGATRHFWKQDERGRWVEGP